MRAFATFLALIALALAGIALFTYPAWLATQALGLDFKFHRIASRIAMLTFFVGFVLVARRLGVADRASLGYANVKEGAFGEILRALRSLFTSADPAIFTLLGRSRFLRELGKAFVLGAVLMLPVLGTMVALDMRVLKPDAALDAAGCARLIALAVGGGLVVALLEETAMRGAMHSAIARESGAVRAVVLVSLVYAASHFFAKMRIPLEQIGPGSGLDMLAGMLRAFADPLAILDAFLCLLAVGVLLGMVRHFTGNIAACIGLHASWVAIITVVRETSARRESGPVAFLMSDYDGFIGWMVLAWTVVIGVALWWWYGRTVVPGQGSRG